MGNLPTEVFGRGGGVRSAPKGRRRPMSRTSSPEQHRASLRRKHISHRRSDDPEWISDSCFYAVPEANENSRRPRHAPIHRAHRRAGDHFLRGAAVYINLVEHPARMACSTELAATVWAPSYGRATWMQAPLAVTGFLASALAWWLGAGLPWLVAGLLILAVVPVTLVIIFPTNKKLLAPGRDLGSPETRELLV